MDKYLLFKSLKMCMQCWIVLVSFLSHVRMGVAGLVRL
ncbi:unnamed protein product [Arabidopsis halleri]